MVMQENRESLLKSEIVASQPVEPLVDDREPIGGNDIIINDEEENEIALSVVSETEETEEDESFENEEKILEPYDPHDELPHYVFPPVDLLEEYPNAVRSIEEKEAEIKANKLRIQDTLMNYGVQIQSISAIEGPTVTLYEIVPAPGVRISKIKNLEDDIALSLSALGIRIIAPMPGKNHWDRSP